MLINPSAMLSHLPALTLDRDGVIRVVTGRSIESSQARVEDRDRFVRLCDETGALVGVGEYGAVASRVVKPRVILEGKG